MKIYYLIYKYCQAADFNLVCRENPTKIIKSTFPDVRVGIPISRSEHRDYNLQSKIYILNLKIFPGSPDVKSGQAPEKIIIRF